MLSGTGLEAHQISVSAWRIVPVPGRSGDAKTRVAAQLASPSPVIDPVPIVVTATKRREEWINAPRSIAVVLPNSMQQGDADAGTRAVAKNQDGMILAGSGSGRNQMFLRGVADSPFGGMN